MSGGRRRAESAPTRPAPQSETSAWALKAATSSQNVKIPSTSSKTSSEISSTDAARIQNVARSNVSRQMYTSNPPVSIEVEERRRQDMLRASAVAMARKMFAIQQAQIDEARGIQRSDSHFAADTARRRAQSDAANKASATADVPPRYENLEDAARRLAQDRLSKLHDEHADYRQYYGQQSPPQRSRLTLRRGRRTSSIQEDSDSDEEQSRKIRSQMSIFQSKLAEVDTKKRQADRDALLAAAHKNVTARMNAMDEKVFSETGKTSPHQRELWERQARERAQRESDERMINVGKVHVGGGKYLEQSEIDAIAKARLQPTLDEITEKAEQQRARDEEIRLEQEKVKAEQATEKQRQAEIKAEQKAAAGESANRPRKASTDQIVDREKAEQKAQKSEENRKLQDQKNEERRVRNEQKAAERKARDEATATGRERRRTEKEDKSRSEPGKTRLLPSFLSRGAVGVGVGAGAAIGAATAAVAEGTGHAAGGGARALTAASPTTGHARAESDEIHGGTVHDQVTVDPAEAAHVVAAAADAEEDTRPVEASKPTEEGIGPKDENGVRPNSGTEPQEQTPPTSPLSAVSAASPSKRDSRVKSWFKKFKTGSKAENDFSEKPMMEAEPEPVAAGRTTEAVKSIDEEVKPESGSIRNVALAGRSENETDDMYGGSVKPTGRVSPIQDDPVGTGNGPGPAVAASGQRAGSISSVTEDTSSLGEEPYVMAADVASSKYSAEHGSKRDSGVDQMATLSDTDSEPRGRKGFRERFLKKVIPGRDKEKQKSVTEPASAAAAAEQTSAPVAETVAPANAEHDSETGTHANPEPAVLSSAEPLREKIQEPSTTSTEATGTTTVTGATTPALTHAKTNGDEDEDFEEARDTFDDGRIPTPSAAKMVDVGAAKTDGAKLVQVNTPTTSKGEGGVGSTGEKREGSRFTEEL